MAWEGPGASRLALLEALLSIYEETEELAHIGSWRAHVGPESVLELTSEARRLLGFEPQATVRNLDFFNVVHPDDRERLLETIIKVRSEQVHAEVELRIARNGAERVLAIIAAPAGGAPAGDVVGTIQDVTGLAGQGGVQRRSLERDLRHGIGERQLFIEYQPIISLHTDSVIGAEALVRWEHPELGRVGPDDFIDLAEESGLIVPLGAWVLEQSCEELARWRREAILPAAFKLSVNLSAAQLWQEGFAAQLAQTLEKVDVPWGAISLEVTETVLIEGVLETTLQSVREHGVHIVIDDFGTKYSALGYLPRLPVDGLKIDASFVQGIEEGPGRLVVSAIAALGRALGLEVTAEGVETDVQLAAVREVGCDAAQGFLMSPPLPAEAFLEYLSRHRGTSR